MIRFAGVTRRSHLLHHGAISIPHCCLLPEDVCRRLLPNLSPWCMHMFWNRSEYLPKMLKTSATVAGWLGVYLLGSYLYFSLTSDVVLRSPALLLPSLMPLGALSAWVSWQIEEELVPACVKPSVTTGKASILPLLCMSVFYSSVVEGFLYEWFLHGDLRPLLRIGLDLMWLSPFFTDAAATYVYERLLGENHQRATNYVATQLRSFAVPLLGFWFIFSVVGNEISNPILSFMIFDFGIIVWTVFFTWANQVDLPETLRTSPYGLLRRLGVLNDILSRPLGRVYRSKLFGSCLLDLLILIFSLAIASELWLADVASPTTLATVMAITFAGWKACEFWMENHRLAQSNHTPKPDTNDFRDAIHWPIGIRVYFFDTASVQAKDAVELVLKLDDPVLTPLFPVENPRHEL